MAWDKQDVAAPVLIVIDALDESGDAISREQILRLLAGKLRTSSSQLIDLPANFRILITSRPLRDIVDILGSTSNVRHISMDDIPIAPTEHDIHPRLMFEDALNGSNDLPFSVTDGPVEGKSQERWYATEIQPATEGTHVGSAADIKMQERIEGSAVEEAQEKWYATEIQLATEDINVGSATDNEMQERIEGPATEKAQETWYATEIQLAIEDTNVGSAADDEMQAKIEEAVRRLPKERKCPEGYAWVQNSTGFRCAGGAHSISWEELNKLGGSNDSGDLPSLATDGPATEAAQEKLYATEIQPATEGTHVGNAAVDMMQEKIKGSAVEEAQEKWYAAEIQAATEDTDVDTAADDMMQEKIQGWAVEEVQEKLYATEIQPATEDTRVGSVADHKMQAKIEEVFRRLPKERKCPQGFAWIRNSTGFRCAGGSHSISWEEFNKLGGSDD
jgi:hypothetical protein